MNIRVFIIISIICYTNSAKPKKTSANKTETVKAINENKTITNVKLNSTKVVESETPVKVILRPPPKPEPKLIESDQ